MRLVSRGLGWSLAWLALNACSFGSSVGSHAATGGQSSLFGAGSANIGGNALAPGSGGNTANGGAQGGGGNAGASLGMSAAGSTALAGEAGAAGFPSSELPAVPDPTEFVSLTWNARDGASYSLDVQPVGQDWVGPCVGVGVLGQRLSYIFDGRCSSAAGLDVRQVAAFRLCSSLPAAGETWTAATASCLEVPYVGGAALHIASPSTATGITLRWPAIPEATYALQVHMKSGQIVDNCLNAALLGSATSLVFGGHCPSNTATPDVSLSDVASFEIDSAIDDQWTEPRSRDVARADYDGVATEVSLSFAGFQNLFFGELCANDPKQALQFSSGKSLQAQTCHIAGSSYAKRRWSDRSQYVVASYPRSYRDSDGNEYELFATPPGGFTPAGMTGCSELNWIRTRDSVSYDVVQLERLCGYSRLDNGEITIIGGKMYIAYHTITANGECIAAGNQPGRNWVIRLKVSSDFNSETPTFTDLSGNPGFETVSQQCLPNASNDGFWEPFVFQSADGNLRVAFSDDSPPEVTDGQCNQFIRVLTYSAVSHAVVASDAVGACPGDRRDGMPVVAQTASGKYFMSLESLGAPSNQVVMLGSEDGGATWPTRTVVADTALDGGQAVGCPYLAFDGEEPYLSFYHLFTGPSGAVYGAFQLRLLDATLARRADIDFEMRRLWDASDDLDTLFWGAVHLENGQIHAVASSWSHPFSEAWLALEP